MKWKLKVYIKIQNMYIRECFKLLFKKHKASKSIVLLCKAFHNATQYNNKKIVISLTSLEE